MQNFIERGVDIFVHEDEEKNNYLTNLFHTND